MTRLDPTLISAELVQIGGSGAPRHELLAMAWIAGQRSPRTRYSYTGIARRWFEWLGANGVDPLDVARVHVELFQRRLEQLDRKPGTIALYLTALSSFYAYCVDEGVLTKNPVDRVKRPSTSERLSNDRQWHRRPPGPTPRRKDRLMGADDLLAADHIDVDHLLTEHRAACDELHRLRRDRGLLLGVVRQLHGWITELDRDPSGIADYLLVEPEDGPAVSALLEELAR